ncbi:ATP-dependent helicase [Celeribacter indicus]|uniref:DNA 3'-5' helicase n=1 Tax=Celeribacter indicus TaxID=1208324 RepID=A0A0B5E6J0_9RHOB|nr:UvrD-helicase domain-containing protein [Celeribacter indicus]AJE47937.1 ATP-dependent DNA helicase PcrA [Celeribacter indicus]SDW27385.1 DNA helicase-2 / ATP-dependent DNA helicase PcrA [Celeribacter indicus]
MSSFNEDDAFEAAARPSLSQMAMASRPAPYLDGLNPAQREAVEALDGPVLMLAGAGTGKTKALTCRIAHLLNTGRARPNEILAVTFTNKAAREMKDRVAGLMGHAIEGMPWLGTFHSVCVRQLRRHAELAGLRSNFTILDTDDQIRLLKQLISAAGIDEKRWPARQLAGIIDGWKNRALTPGKVPGAEGAEFNGRATRLYADYQERLKTLNAVDFGDLLLHMVTIFQEHPDLLAQYQRWYRYILVDEYQDTNVAQYLWLRLLAQGHRNICCVGDDDQSIYGWRGAEVGNILRFEKDFPGAKVIRLEQNYRSTPHILAAASSVISANTGRLGKELWTDVAEGEKVRLIGHWDGEVEARWVGEEIEALHGGTSRYAKQRNNPRSKDIVQEFERLAKKGALGGVRTPEELYERFRTQNSPLKEFKTRKLMWDLTERWQNEEPLHPAFHRFSMEEIAILVRASHQMRAFEDRFLTIGLPYRVIGGPRFYERMEIRDAMAYFRVVTQPSDDLAFERIINTPKRGVGDKALQEIQIAARANGMSLLDGARIAVGEGLLKGKAKAGVAQLIADLDRWASLNVQQIRYPGVDDEDAVVEDVDYAPAEISHVELAEKILDESGYTAMWQNDKSPEAPGRLENLKELVKALEQFDNLAGFLEHVALIMDNESEEQGEKVTIMTLHAAKGLEFPVVFLPGWEEGLFPSQRSMDENGLKGLEEERRLAYVGITRAEELCTISFAANRRVYGQWQSQLASRFIDELDPEHVDVMTPSGLYGANAGFAAGGAGGGMSSFEDRAAKADVYNSPGWKRMQARAGQRGMRQPAESRHMVIDATATSAYTVGDRVFHKKFGYGEVIEIEGDKLTIEFDHSGPKKLVAGFVLPADQAGDVPF